MKNLNLYINEKSINAKKRDKKFAKDLLMKGKRVGNIKSFGIITAENPEAKALSNQENRKMMRELTKILKNAHYNWQTVDGHFGGNREHSLMIFNITREVLQNLAKKFHQQSYIFATLEKDGEFPTFEYWEKQDPEKAANNAKNPYIKQDESVKWVQVPDAEDNYTVIGKHFKFNINFSIFEELNDKLEQNIQKIMEMNDTFISNDHDKLLEYSIIGTGMRGSWYHRKVNQG